MKLGSAALCEAPIGLAAEIWRFGLSKGEPMIGLPGSAGSAAGVSPVRELAQPEITHRVRGTKLETHSVRLVLIPAHRFEGTAATRGGHECSG